MENAPKKLDQKTGKIWFKRLNIQVPLVGQNQDVVCITQPSLAVGERCIKISACSISVLKLWSGSVSVMSSSGRNRSKQTTSFTSEKNKTVPLILLNWKRCSDFNKETYLLSSIAQQLVKPVLAICNILSFMFCSTQTGVKFFPFWRPKVIYIIFFLKIPTVIWF